DRTLIHCILAGLLLLATAGPAWSQDVPDSPAAQSRQKLQDLLPMKTLGGRHYWGDVTYFQGWKIQQNVLTKHFRLLDDMDRRHAWGTRKQCQARLDEIQREQNLPDMSGHAVILLHGIIRSSKSMSRIKKRLTESGFVTIPFDYPSTQVDLDHCSEYLDQVVKSLHGIKQISFVTHSLGGLVVRNWLREHSDQRTRRLVMIGTPNKGAEMADKLQDWAAYRLILGPAGQQLISGGEGAISQLPVPKFEFAIIAGAKGTRDGYNLMIPGDDDGTVTIRSAQLEGAADFMTLPVLHSFLPLNAEVIDCTDRFLKTGAFRKTGQKNPVATPSAEKPE
ncbi:MAG: alpha/beta fold hydrolase, partial [Planctomycetaceae bacterium]